MRPHYKLLSKGIRHDVRRLFEAMSLWPWGIKFCGTLSKPRSLNGFVSFPWIHILFNFAHRYQWTELLMFKSRGA